jgi:hypothetical protein
MQSNPIPCPCPLPLRSFALRTAEVSSNRTNPVHFGRLPGKLSKTGDLRIEPRLELPSSPKWSGLIFLFAVKKNYFRNLLVTGGPCHNPG